MQLMSRRSHERSREADSRGQSKDRAVRSERVFSSLYSVHHERAFFFSTVRRAGTPPYDGGSAPLQCARGGGNGRGCGNTHTGGAAGSC